jgi:DNA polymerase III epsilon subunit family exonuclease
MEPVPAATPLDQLPAAVVDFETTGLRAFEGHAVIEVGVVHVDGLEVREDCCLSRLVDPQREVSEGSFDVHGISTERLQGQPLFAEVLPGLLRMIEGRAMIAHNAAFDASFLRAEMARLDLAPPVLRLIDTVLLARTVFARSEHGYGLDQVAGLLDLDATGMDRHRALDDALLTARAYVGLVERLMAQGVHTLEDLQLRCTRVALRSGKGHGTGLDEVIACLDHAIRARVPVTIDYLSPKRPGPDGKAAPHRTKRVIEPHALRGLWVDGYCRLRSDHRTFRLDRIERCEPL